MLETRALETLFDRVPIPVLELDGEGRVTASNGAFRQLFRLREEEITRKAPETVILPPEERHRMGSWIEKARLGREIRRNLRCQRKNGTFVEVEWHLIPRLRDEDCDGFFAVCRDLSRERHLEDQLDKAKKMESIGHLTGGIAHDFNNLLTVILGYAEMLEIRLGEDIELRDTAHEIRNAAERASDLTRRLLAFSRERDVCPMPLQINTVILELERMLSRLIGEKIRIETGFDIDLGKVRMDRLQLEQVLMNLVINARDAMLPEGGRLWIETCECELTAAPAEFPACSPGRYACFRVRDEGCGMDEGTRARMFDPYFTTKPEGQGTGLGLASVFGIVTQSGGYVRVTSAPGQGSVFEVGLPLLVDSLTQVEAGDPSGRIGVGRETILVVEDDSRVREMTRDYLRLSGYSVLEADSAGEALRAAETHDGPIHLLLTDVVMPDADGPTLARYLTAKRPEMKVLYQSGYGDNEVLRQGGPEPGWGYLQKPMRQKTMTQKVREILDG